MDARPFRPVRQAPNLGNENLVPGAKGNAQHRNKAAGNPLTMASNGALKGGAAKRNALADSSNVSKPVFPAASSGAVVKKQGSIVTSNTGLVAKAQENSGGLNKAKDTLSRPAQRPTSKTGSIAHSTSMAQIRSGSNIAQGPSGPKQPLGWKRPAKSMVYNDSQSEKDRQVPEPSNGTTMKKTIRESVYVDAQSTLRQPRHYQSQPVLKSQAASRSLLSNDPKVMVVPKPERGRVSAPSEKTDWNKDGRDRSARGWDRPVLADEPVPGSYTSSVQDDVAEPPYLDAVEELPKDDQYPKPTAIDEPLVAIDSLPEPIMPTKIAPKTEAKMVEFQPDLLPPAHADDLPDLSDYEEDYYDDQGYTTAHSTRSRGDNTTGGVTTVLFPPKVTKKDASEIEAARQIVDNKRTPEEDAEEAWDVSMVAEYGDDIFNYMRDLEMTMLPNAHYMDIQTEIQWSMRSVLMDWVIQVHTRFGLLPETLFLTVNYIDRFLSCKIVSLGKLQLVGATAIFVAAKYEEINCPSVQEIVYMVDGGYSIDEILKAERFMLSMLNFELGWPGPMSFLRRISKADDYDLESRTLSKYFLEVTLMDERFVASPPSYIAAGAHCLSRMILEKGDWTPDHVHYSGYTLSQLKPLVSMMLDCCRIARKHHAAVFEKYADRKYKRVSSFVEGQVQKGFRLPFQSAAHQRLSYGYWEEDVSQLQYPTNRGLKMFIPTEV